MTNLVAVAKILGFCYNFLAMNDLDRDLKAARDNGNITPEVVAFCKSHVIALLGKVVSSPTFGANEEVKEYPMLVKALESNPQLLCSVSKCADDYRAIMQHELTSTKEVEEKRKATLKLLDEISLQTTDSAGHATPLGLMIGKIVWCNS